MKKYLLCLSLLTFSLSAVEPSKELQYYSEQALVDADLNAYIQQFPFQLYTICEVPRLGSFYIDDVVDGIKTHLKKGIYWEEGIGRLIGRYTLPRTLAVDLGAHIGIHTITMSKRVGPDGLVITFEPQRKIFREQLFNLQLNKCSHNVISLPLAVGEAERFIEMEQPNPENEGGTSIGSGGDRALMIPLDNLNLENVSCIKIDVERYELKVFQGAKQTLIRNMPVIIFEILGNHDLDTCTGDVKAEYEETVSFLTNLGYSVLRIFGNDFIAFPPHRWLEKMIFEEQQRWELEEAERRKKLEKIKKQDFF